MGAGASAEEQDAKKEDVKNKMVEAYKDPSFSFHNDDTGPPKGTRKGNGKGKKGKGKGQGNKSQKRTAKEIGQIMKGKFQIMLQGEFKDYRDEENNVLKRAYLVGQPNCFFSLRGQDYEYNFDDMKQKNKGTGKERKFRAPQGMTRPKKPVLPPGPTIIVTVPNPRTDSMEVPDPNNPGNTVTVAIPPGAKPGMRLAVPIAKKGESQEDVVKRQQGWSTGSKVAVGAAAVGALAVGGVVLGEHLSGGALSAWGETAVADVGEAIGSTEAGAAVLDAAGDAGDWVGDAAGDVGDWAGDAAGDVGDWAGDAAGDVGDWAGDAAGDVGDWAGDAAGDAGDWAGDAAGDVGDWAGDAFGDAGDWFGDAGEDVGDFVMDMF